MTDPTTTQPRSRIRIVRDLGRSMADRCLLALRRRRRLHSQGNSSPSSPAETSPELSEFQRLFRNLSLQPDSLGPVGRDIESQFLEIGRTLEKLPGESHDLVTSSEKLSSLSHEIELRFMAIGNALQELPAASEDLIQRSEKLIEMASGRGAGKELLENTASSVQVPLRYIDHYGATVRELLTRLHQAADQIQRMLNHEGHLRQIVAPLKFIRTLFKVESSGLAHEIQSMFLALTEDIHELQRKVTETFSEKFQILRDTQRTLISVIGRLEEQSRRQQALVQGKKRQMEQSLIELRTDLEQNQRRDIRLTKVSQAISGEVSCMVMGLQAQDIISQKVAHVLTALEKLQERLPDYARSATAAERAGHLQFFAQSATIEQAQLKAVRQDLEVAADHLASAIRNIESQITGLDDGSITLKDFDRVTTGIDGLVQVLLETIQDVRDLVQSILQSASEAYDSIRPLGGQTSDVTSMMRQLSAQIRLIALNAQVQAARTGAGTGLEVLAAATARVSVEAGNISEEIASQLDQFGADLDRLVNSFAELRDEGLAHSAEWEANGRADEARLHGFRDAALTEMEQISISCERIRGLARSMDSKVDLKAIADRRIQDPHDTLGEIARLSREVLARPEYAGLAPALDPTLDLAGKYTMESERQIHEAVIASAAAAAVLAGKTGPDTSETPNLSLPLDAAPPADVASSVSPSGKEFGDNVDLF